MSPGLEPAALRDSAPIFSALGDPNRLWLIAELCAGGAMSITALTSKTAITRQAVTKHLAVFSGARLVRDAKVGRERLWQFEPRQVEEARRSLDLISEQWSAALIRLKLAVEAD